MQGQRSDTVQISTMHARARALLDGLDWQMRFIYVYANMSADGQRLYTGTNSETVKEILLMETWLMACRALGIKSKIAGHEIPDLDAHQSSESS